MDTVTKTTHPTLYKLNTDGKSIQFWEISVEGTDIVTRYGQVGTQSPQLTRDTIKEGKNLGKVNETTAEEQARLEAKAKWTKQMDLNGYIDDIEKAKKGIRAKDFPIPMLAHVYADHGHKLPLPLVVQPKMDGIRALARKNGRRVTLFSRKGKEFTGLPHLNEAISSLDFEGVLDGELYSHKYRDNFEHIVHLVKQERPCLGHQEVEFHIFDAVVPGGFAQRWEWIKEQKFEESSPYLKLVETKLAYDKAAIERFYDEFAEQNYEGVMCRNQFGEYEHKRSYTLQKYKQFQDDEFEIVGVVEGKGRLTGHGIFVCRTKDETEFKAKMEGPIENLRDFWVNQEKYIGKILTVQYQGISTKNSVPRFPVGKRFREHE